MENDFEKKCPMHSNSFKADLSNKFEEFSGILLENKNITDLVKCLEDQDESVDILFDKNITEEEYKNERNKDKIKMYALLAIFFKKVFAKKIISSLEEYQKSYVPDEAEINNLTFREYLGSLSERINYKISREYDNIIEDDFPSELVYRRYKELLDLYKNCNKNPKKEIFSGVGTAIAVPLSLVASIPDLLKESNFDVTKTVIKEVFEKNVQVLSTQLAVLSIQILDIWNTYHDTDEEDVSLLVISPEDYVLDDNYNLNIKDKDKFYSKFFSSEKDNELFETRSSEYRDFIEKNEHPVLSVIKCPMVYSGYMKNYIATISDFIMKIIDKTPYYE